jgi:hypothetical protein
MNKNPVNPKDVKNIINSELEKDLLGLLVQGYTTIKKHFNRKQELQESCPKCGSNLINTQWCPSTNGKHSYSHNLTSTSTSTFKDHDKEVLHKWCQICHYQYVIDPLS